MSNIKILGKINYEKLPKLYNENDIKIYASKFKHLEWQCWGYEMWLPILATKNKISKEDFIICWFFCKDTVSDIKDGSYQNNRK